VRYTAHDLAAAITVASYLPGSELAEVQKGPDAVALWLGPDFDRVASSRDADAATVQLPAEEPRCHTPQS
jgi:hypothetical protein